MSGQPTGNRMDIITNPPSIITFTGLDDRTDLRAASELSKRYPIEWGILYSNTNRDARFPSLQTIMESVVLNELHGIKSLHLCGSAARKFTNPDRFAPQGIEQYIRCFNRIQVNGCDKLPESKLDASLPGIILQRYVPHFDADIKEMQLFDMSGGTGKLPEHIPSIPPGKFVGFAGGMGPDTVAYYVKRIPGTNERYWIDMETNVRSNGWFDLEKVRKVCEILYPNR